jgi:hypothetical protein
MQTPTEPPAPRPTTRWAAWLIGVLATFFALEAPALRQRVAEKPSGTLTATMRRWLGIEPAARRRTILGPLFGAFCTYLFGHFLFGWWRS